jgi:hypothetical protein
MRRRRIFWQLFPAAVSVTLIALLALGWHTLSTLRQVYYQHVADGLLARNSRLPARLTPSASRSAQVRPRGLP